MRRVLRIAGLTGLISYTVVCLTIVRFERDIVFPAPESPSRLWRWSKLQIPGGTTMLWAPAADFAPVVVFFHGNAEQIAEAEWLADRFHASGIAFAAVEYPGYAGLPGTPSEASLRVAAEAALTHLVGPMSVAPSRIVLIGQSLGTGVAVQLAAAQWGRKLVLISPYTSLPDLGAERLPFLPVRLLMKNHFDSAELAPRVHQPVLIVHGTQDTVVPFEHGQALSTLFEPDARFIGIDGGTHFDLWDRTYVQDRVAEFILQ